VVTPLRAVRIPDEVWHAAQARAAAEGTTVSAVILRALVRYGRGAPKVEKSDSHEREDG
jgi:hypothetical protein